MKRSFLQVVGAGALFFASTFAGSALGQEANAEQTGQDQCGGNVIRIAQMSWPSAAILAHVHQKIIEAQFGCTVELVQGDPNSTLSSMATTGQPAIAPELWVNQVAAIWNSMNETRQVRALGPTFSGGSLEGWFVPRHVADLYPDILSVEGLRTAASAQVDLGEKFTFVSCPSNWACAVINRNMLAAHGLDGLVTIAEPANRFEMDTLIAQAVSNKSPLVFYYWQPNALLAQFDMPEIDLGGFDQEAFACLADNVCADPLPSDFVIEGGNVVVSDWVIEQASPIARYLGKATISPQMFNHLIAWQAESAAQPEQLAEYFLATQPEIWQSWVLD